MHVSLRRLQIQMRRELLDGFRGRASHREVRTEGVPQHVDSLSTNTRAARRCRIAFSTALRDRLGSVQFFSRARTRCR